MKPKTWRKHHKWLGLLFAFFMLIFCISGIILNHRSAVAGVNVSRAWLPQRYHYENWNGGLLRGTLSCMGKDSSSNILVYGTGGIWRKDARGGFADFNSGIPEGADYRQIRAMVQTPRGELFALSPFSLYRRDGNSDWRIVSLPVDDGGKLTDMICRGDTLVVLSRSFVYTSVPPYSSFTEIQLKSPIGYEPETTLFRTVWLLHSGELFGTAGKIVVDIIGVILIVLCITGILIWLLPKQIKRSKHHGHTAAGGTRLMRLSLLCHDTVGRTTIILTLLLALTGWCLRPPLMIPLVLNKVGIIPGTELDSPNAWRDKLRMIRYDADSNEWLLSTSEGFYSLKTLRSVPCIVKDTPPVSVMGLNVWQQDEKGRWLCGSFSGMCVWDRHNNTVTDYFTGKPATKKKGIPISDNAVSGYSADLTAKPFSVDYYGGTAAIAQPERFATLPMSLWNVALEVHSGRIYIGTLATYIFVFFAGIAAVWCLWSGYRIRKRK